MAGDQMHDHKDDLPSTEEIEEQNNVTNPFDAGLLDRLHRAAFTPSVFARVVSPSHSTDSPVGRPSTSRSNARRRRFRWSIDHIAAINPAEIDESGLSLQESTNQYDDATEARFQEAIDKFFSQPVIAPSPWKTVDNAGASVRSTTDPQPTNRDEHSPAEIDGVSFVETDCESELCNTNELDDDIGRSVYLLSSSPESINGSPFKALNNHQRTSIGNRLSSPDISPIKGVTAEGS